MNKQDEQINQLNSMVKMRIAPSPIHGVGIFATRKILQGEKLYAANFPQPFRIPMGSMDKLFPEVKALILERWPQIVNGSAFMWPDTNHQAYCNHSDNPNYDANLDIAIRDIDVGEEITENYKLIPGHDVVFSWL